VPITEMPPEPMTLALWTAGVIQRKAMIAAFAFGTLLLTLVASVVLPPSYRVTVSFAPNANSSSKLGAMLGSSGLAGLAGSLTGGAAGGLSEPTESPEFYAQLLQSRELLTRLLTTRFPDPRTATPRDSARLVDIMKLRSDDPARRLELGVKALSKSIRTESDARTNLVKVTVDERYPRLAAEEANTALSLVNSFNLQQRSSRARGKRIYLQQRVIDARAALAAAQARYRDFLSGNRQWRTSPTLASDEETLRRDEEVASDLYLTLEKQYEMARLDEFNDAALITVVDSAVPPVKPYWPHYTLLIPGALLLGLFLGVIVAGIATVYADWSRRDPAAARALAGALRRRARSTTKPPVARRA
jgi:uncharacterized protein involved in exopolysaccharide biosynthesis